MVRMQNIRSPFLTLTVLLNTGALLYGRSLELTHFAQTVLSADL
jgi:hypothetical protein